MAPGDQMRSGRTRTAKALARRIDMEYFQRLHPFRRWRMMLSIAAPAAVLLFVAVMSAAGSRAPYSSGPLSAAHQVFGERCERCHVTPAAGTPGFRAHVTDMACVACHDGPPHKANQTLTPACASCHLDHRGAIQLAAVDDRTCTQCHGNLTTTTGQPTVAREVGAFHEGHPEFAALRTGAPGTSGTPGPPTGFDPAVLRFNHEVHLKSDLRGPAGATTLECSTCHAPAAAGPAAGPPSTRGRALMAPVTYTAHCASCHPLYFDPLIDAAVPHDTPEKVHAVVVQSLQQFIAERPDQIGRPDPVRGRIPVSFPAPMRQVRTAAEWTAERTAMAGQLLWSKTCAECHRLEFPAATPPAPGPALPRVVPTNVAKEWMPRARFDHRAHQLATCTSCHAAQASRETSDVLMPSIATCQTCHTSRNGAEARCFECHGYHDWTKAKPAASGFDLRQLTTERLPQSPLSTQSVISSADSASSAVIVN